ncbi:MAG TPA: hypothetical protein VIX73_14955, partial [Kofleriaceae bacterium]
MAAIWSAERSSAPLRYRLPNPPPIFVGRRREVAWLRAALVRSPLAVVCGAGGIGKTALVLHTLRDAPDADRGILVRLAPSHGASLRLEIVRALSEALRCPVDWTALQGDGEATARVVVDLVERAPGPIVLDDLHHGAPGEVRDLLVDLARYVRRSRLIAASRTAVAAPELADLVVMLGPMPDADLLQLGRQQL